MAGLQLFLNPQILLEKNKQAVICFAVLNAIFRVTTYIGASYISEKGIFFK